MKRTVKKTLALLIALVMALPTFALAEAPLDVPDDRETVVYEGGDIVSDAVDESYEEAGELTLGGDDAKAEDEAAPLFEEEPQDAVATWWFIVDDTLIATQEVREGDAIAIPEAPVCPEGTVFDGWFLEDGTPLFIDADGDGETDPVIAHPDPLFPEVNVIGRYVEKIADDAREGMGVTASDTADADSDTVTDGAEPADAPAEETTSFSPDGALEGACQPGLAENSPLESFPGAAASPEGEGSY